LRFNDKSPLVDKNARDQIEGFDMSFLDNVKRQEQEKHRTSAWSQSVNHLSRFIRQHLRKAEAESPLKVTADLLRVDKVLLDRLTVFLHEERVTVSPLSLSDSRAPEHGGCILVQSTNGVAYHLLWDGISPVVQHWAIVPAGNRPQTDKVKLDHLTVSHADSVRGEAQPLSEKSLDEAFETLFGLANRVESNPHQAQRPVKLFASPPILTLSQKSPGYSARNGHNGKEH
jgi:hypothetical protein